MAVVLVLGILVAGYLILGQALSNRKNPNDTGVSVRRSDGTLTGSEITADSSTWPGGDRVWNICAAIAIAEGFDQGEGSVPFDFNNPGDISDYSNVYGSQRKDGSSVTTFPTAEVGWQKLYEKVNNMVSGRSSVYSNKNWIDVAQSWAGKWENWVNNVTNYLGVDQTSFPKDYNG